MQSHLLAKIFEAKLIRFGRNLGKNQNLVCYSIILNKNTTIWLLLAFSVLVVEHSMESFYLNFVEILTSTEI